MDLFIEIIDGPLKGTRTQLRDGLTLGRRDCDLNIDDSKVSSKHAQVEERPDGSFWLVDLGSSNGIRIDGKRAQEVRLQPNESFRLGRTRLQVLGAGVAAFDGLQTQVKDVFKKAKGGQKSWREQIVHLTERGLRETEPKKRPNEIAPFPRAIKMSFRKGMQSGTEWVLGYGPRDVGASSVDLPLFEPGLAARCFRLVGQDDEIVIRVQDEMFGKILLYGKRFESAYLRAGDVLELGNTQIFVSYEALG